MIKIVRHLSVVLFSLIVLTSCSKNEPLTSGYLPVKDSKLFYQVFGKGDPIIVLHGGPGLDQSYLLPQMLELAKDHQVIFYDQRGSGKSLETPMTAEYLNLEQFTEDLEEVRKDLGLEKFILLGNSWGGILAMNYAIQYPEHVSSLILMSTGPADYKGGQAFLKELTVRTESMGNVFDQAAFSSLDARGINELYKKLFSVYFYQPINVEMLSLNFTEESSKSGAIVRDHVSKTSWMKPGFDLFPQLKNLKIPTLIIAGKDDIVPLWTAEEIKTTIPGADLLVLKRCGHFPYVEQPDEMFLGIRKFLEGSSSVTHLE